MIQNIFFQNILKSVVKEKNILEVYSKSLTFILPVEKKRIYQFYKWQQKNVRN